jgi:hypothetical protein
MTPDISGFAGPLKLASGVPWFHHLEHVTPFRTALLGGVVGAGINALAKGPDDSLAGSAFRGGLIGGGLGLGAGYGARKLYTHKMDQAARAVAEAARAPAAEAAAPVAAAAVPVAAAPVAAAPIAAAPIAAAPIAKTSALIKKIASNLRRGVAPEAARPIVVEIIKRAQANGIHPTPEMVAHNLMLYTAMKLAAVEPKKAGEPVAKAVSKKAAPEADYLSTLCGKAK